MVEDGTECLAIFASEFAIELLRKATLIAVDGTFTTCPAPFYQLFILQAQVVNGTTYPVVFGLLPNKCSATYLKFFTEVAAFSEDMFKRKWLPILFLDCQCNISRYSTSIYI